MHGPMRGTQLPSSKKCHDGTDGDAAISLVEAATAAGVDQYVMVTSLGTGKWGWPAGACQRLLFNSDLSSCSGDKAHVCVTSGSLVGSKY